MPNAKSANKPGHITTGNVLEDLGFSQQEIREMEIKYDLWDPIRTEIETRELKQAQLATVLGIHQPDASLLLRGQIERFSITRLMEFAHRLGLAVTLTVVPAAKSTMSKNRARILSRKAASTRRLPAKATIPVRRRATA